MTLPPGPSLPAALQLGAFLLRLGPFLESCQRRYGDLFTLTFPGLGHHVIASSPEAIRQCFTGPAEVLYAGRSNAFLTPVLGPSSVLILDREPHLRQRRLLLPPFHGERMGTYVERMREATERMLAQWPVGEPFAVQPHMQALTLEVILHTVFGVVEPGRRRELAWLLERLQAYAGVAHQLFLPVLQRDLGPLSPWGRFLRHRERVDRELLAEVARRRTEPPREDVLSLLLEARDEQGQPMTDGELRDELVTLLVAGYDTTASALAWGLECLLSAPQVQARLEAELREVVGTGPLRAEHLPRLEYLDAVVKEVLRLCSIVPLVSRKLRAPFEVGGYTLPAGVLVMPCPYLLHRRPELYPQPHTFRPERFVGVRPGPYEWAPFGGGTRRCIGMAFALQELKVVLATLLLRLRLRLAGPAPSRAVRRGVLLEPHGGVRLVAAVRAGE